MFGKNLCQSLKFGQVLIVRCSKSRDTKITWWRTKCQVDISNHDAKWQSNVSVRLWKWRTINPIMRVLGHFIWWTALTTLRVSMPWREQPAYLITVDISSELFSFVFLKYSIFITIRCDIAYRLWWVFVGLYIYIIPDSLL